MDNIIETIFGKEIEETKKEDFRVDTLKKANWCATMADSAFKKILEAEQMKEEAMARIDEWFEDYTKEYKGTIDKMEELLDPWVWDEIKEKKSKSIKLLNGTAGFRSTPESIKIKDDKAIVEEAKMYGIPVQTKEYVNKTDIEKHIKETGQILDNACIVPGSEKFYLKMKEE